MLKSKKHHQFLLLFFVFSVFFCIIGLLFPDSKIIRFVAFLCFMCYLFSLLYASFLFFYLFLLYIYAFLGQIISLLVNESGVYLTELNVTTNPNGSTLLLIILVSLFLFVNFYAFNIITKNSCKIYSSPSQTKMVPIVIGVNLIYIALFSLVLILYGNAYDSVDGNRVVYRHEYIPVWARILIDIQWLPVLMLGFILLFNKKRIFFTFLILHLYFRLMFGEKFTMLAQLTYLAFIPFILCKHDFIKIKYFIRFGIGVCILLIASLLINYVLLQGAGIERFIQRVAQQGQLWWYAVEYYQNNVNLDLFSNELSSSLLGDCKNGLDLLMCQTMPASIYNSYVSNGYVLTSGYPSILLYYFGSSAFIVFIMLSPFASIPLFLLFYSVKKGKLIATVVALRVFYSFFFFYGSGDFYQLFNFKTLLYIVFWIVLYYTPRITIFRNKNILS